MNYQVSAVETSTNGYGFHITDSGKRSLVHIEFASKDKADEARRVIGESIAIAVNITPFSAR
jgi:hypothetical protein